MAKKKEEIKEQDNTFETNNEVDEYVKHFTDSRDSSADFRGTFSDKEDMLTGNLSDDLSNTTKSRIFDPRLSTIVIERTARIAAKTPTGRAFATSKDDIGKNKVMNLLLENYAYVNANSQFKFLTKVRMADMYSLVYGVQFSLVDWVDNESYQGPDVWLLPIRDCFPQPGAVSIEESDWFQVRTLKGMDWLKSRKNLPGWKNIDELIAKIKGTEGVTRSDLDSSDKTTLQEKREPNIPGNKANPKVILITEYRKDKWVTFSAEHKLILREIANPHKNGELPIVAKYSFPLMDSIYGLGEFERGKTLQFAINSLINLYMDGVKYSLYPPIQINSDGVVPSSIKWAPAEKWLVDRPNVDVQVTQLSPQGLNTFQSTYSFLIAALMNQSGTTDTSVSRETDVSLGKTPEALKMIAERENSRDSWDRYMLEEYLSEVAKKFINLFTINLKKPVALRLFGSEMEELLEIYPDSAELFNSAKKDIRFGRGTVKVDKDMIGATSWDYIVDEGSTLRKDPEENQKALTDILQLVLENDTLEQKLNASGKSLDIGELLREWMSNRLQNWDKIIVDRAPVEGVNPGEQMDMGPAGASQDPEIQSMLDKIMSVTGGIGGIPSE